MWACKPTMILEGQTLTGPSAVAESKRYLTSGVTLGGDVQAQSPAAVATFSQGCFRAR
jgi:hypothetical protein